MFPRASLGGLTTNSSHDSPSFRSVNVSSNSFSHYKCGGDTIARRHNEFMTGFELTREFTQQKNGMLRRFRDEEKLQLSRNRLSKEALLDVKERSLLMLDHSDDLEELFHALAGVLGVVKEALDAPASSPPKGIDR